MVLGPAVRFGMTDFRAHASPWLDTGWKPILLLGKNGSRTATSPQRVSSRGPGTLSCAMFKEFDQGDAKTTST